MKKLVSVLLSVCLSVMFVLPAFAENQVQPSTRNDYTVTTNEKGQTVINSGVIPEGATNVQVQEYNVYRNGDTLQLSNADPQSSDAAMQSDSTTSPLVLLGKLDMTITYWGTNVYSTWTLIMEDYEQIQYVNFDMYLQQSVDFQWLSIQSNPFHYKGSLTYREYNAHEFYGAPMNYYLRTYMTGYITTIEDGQLQMTPANSATIFIGDNV